MKRKDTKVYIETVYNYCDARQAYEMYSEDIERLTRKINKAKNKFNELADIDDEIKNWYNFYVSMTESTLYTYERWKNEAKEKLTKAESVLINDYEEKDLDLLYLKHKL